MATGNFRDVIASSPYIFTIGVAGDSGSGKTTFTGAIRAIFGEELVSTITLDDYHTLDRDERKIREITPLDPRANNIRLLEEHLKELKAGKTIKKPVYNHHTGTFDPPVPFAPTKILILEGLHPFFTPALRENLDFTLFVDPEPEVKRRWKIQRDVNRRGYREEDVIAELEARKLDYDRYVAPQKNAADAVISIGDSKYGENAADKNVYRVTLLQNRVKRKLRNIELSIDLFSILSLSDREFLLEFRIAGTHDKPMGALTFDGELQYDVVRKLEKNVEEQTGIHPISLFTGREYVTAADAIQLLLSWRIINKRMFIEYRT